MKIINLHLLTNDLNETENFYRNILEISVVNKTLSEITFQVGYTLLTFALSENKNPFYHFAFSIPSNKVDEAHAFISKRTNILPFTQETTIADFSNWNAHAFYFHDNQGNIVEFIAHHDLHNDSENPFTSTSIIGVCEIGIPVPDVTEACKTINERFKVPYYVKGPRLQDFSVMGDEYGLFIVTKIGRGWLPTQRPAERFFTKVFFENGNKEAEFVIE